MWTKALRIEGMTCPGCASRIEKMLNRLDGIEIRVSYPDSRGDLKVSGEASLR